MTSISSAIINMVAASLRRSTDQINASVINLASGRKSNASIADFSVGTLLSNQASVLRSANVNAASGKSLLDTAKGALEGILDLLNQQKVLAVKAQDGTLTDNELANLNTEFASHTTEINRLADTTKYNNKTLLNGSISGGAKITTETGQTSENYTLLTTSDLDLSGTVSSTGELVTASTFSAEAGASVGKVKGTAILDFNTIANPLTSDARITIGATGVVDFGDTLSTSATVAADFVLNANLSTDAYVRSFIYTDNLDGTVTVTAADAGTAVNSIEFNMTDDGRGGAGITVMTFGGTSIDGAAIDLDAAATKTLGTMRAPTSNTIDANLEGALTNFQATLSTSGTQNEATFTVDVNGTTYTSQAVTLFSDGGYNSQGNTIKNGQVITFYNTNGPVDGNGEYTDNAFTLTVGATDITIAGANITDFTADLNATAAGFETQLAANKITQNRDIVLAETNATGGDFTVSAATDTVFDGIESFDADGTNAKGDISYISDNFADSGGAGIIGAFSFDSATNKLTTTIDGVTYTADLSDDTVGGGTNGGFDVAGGGGAAYNTGTQVLTAGNGVIIFATADTTDGRQLRLDLSNLTETTIDFGTTVAATAATDALDAIFGVDLTPSLSFQVGASSTDTIGVTIARAGTEDIYVDDAGIIQNLDISTTAGATAAEAVLDNAIDNILGIIAGVDGKTSAFSSAISNNETTANNVQDASDLLLLTDYAAESTLYAQATLTFNAAITALAAENSRLSSISTLLSKL